MKLYIFDFIFIIIILILQIDLKQLYINIFAGGALWLRGFLETTPIPDPVNTGGGTP
tara:strand:+ start:142 stop:312 length:171 start_codon:yes stop_codon:yes gene_type:complete